MSLIGNLIVFKLAWLSSVVGAAQQMPWLGPLAVAIAVGLHLRAAQRPGDEFLLIIGAGLIGACFDTLLVNSGWVSYPSGLISPSLAPYWIITMWMLFATTLNVSLRWLRGRPLLTALFGLLGGPAAYAGGSAMGGIVLVEPTAALVALAIGWALIMPLLLQLSSRFDGMLADQPTLLVETRS